MVLKKNCRQFIFLFSVAIVALAASCGGDAKSKTVQNESAEEVSTEDAVKIFNRKCGLCHGKDGKKQLAGAPDLTQSELTKAERMALIKYGKGSMPPFEEQLNKKEIAAVAEYLETFTK